MNSTSKLLILTLTVVVLTASSNAQSPPEELLKQMVGQLQTKPNDNALREKIIKLAQGVKPRPAIPEQANRAFVKGNVFQKEAKDASGYDLAISAYREALRVAPWWGDAYFNLAVALEAAGKFDEAIVSIKLYMASVPGASAEARDAQNRIYAIEAKSEMASRQASARAAADRERLRPTVEGKWSNQWGISFQVVRNGEQFSIIGGDQQGFKPPTTWRARDVVADRKNIRFLPVSDNPGIRNAPIQLSLSADGSKLEGGYLGPDGGVNITPAYTRVP